MPAGDPAIADVSDDGHTQAVEMTELLAQGIALMRVCVGCSLLPTPALITGCPDHSAARSAASASQWRMTNRSVPIAVRVRIVSLNDSPLVVEERSGLRSITWAPNRCAALSNESLVRVDASKKAVVTVAPARSLDTGLPT